MKKLRYKINIIASVKNIWNTILEKDTYKIWIRSFSANSEVIGEWKLDAELKFFDPHMGGTVARLTTFKSLEHIVATHIATLTKDMVSETQGPMTEKWIGTTESYRLVQLDQSVDLVIDMLVHEDFQEMFDSAWPQALLSIKNLSENK